MTDSTTTRRVVLGMPGYGKQTAAAGRALWNASRIHEVSVEYSPGSLLACNFNKLWCTALNKAHQGERVDYFAMLHDDIGCEDFWLDALIDELEEKQLDVLGVVVPIKDLRGITSIALHHTGDNWNPECRLSMHDIYQLPETFTADDVGGMPLLLNTGCWVAKWNQEWCKQVHFTINDRIVFDRVNSCFRPEVESEDWFFSRCLNDIGLRIGATRKIAVKHEGDVEFTNTMPWGSQAYDTEDSQRYQRKTSPVPGAFPREISGWLTEAEGRALAEFASGKRVLEIGSYCGLSTVCMGRTAEHVTAVDYFDGRGTPQPADTLPAFKQNIERYGLTEKVTIVHPDDEIPGPEYDAAFIDAAHDYESVAADIRRCLAVLKPGGLLAFHDYSHPSHPGIAKAIDELLIDGGELVHTVDTLAVVRPPARVPLEV
jgi:protein-L-isoaspartate O-methyltransferase